MADSAFSVSPPTNLAPTDACFILTDNSNAFLADRPNSFRTSITAFPKSIIAFTKNPATAIANNLVFIKTEVNPSIPLCSASKALRNGKSISIAFRIASESSAAEENLDVRLSFNSSGKSISANLLLNIFKSNVSCESSSSESKRICSNSLYAVFSLAVVAFLAASINFVFLASNPKLCNIIPCLDFASLLDFLANPVKDFAKLICSLLALFCSLLLFLLASSRSFFNLEISFSATCWSAISFKTSACAFLDRFPSLLYLLLSARILASSSFISFRSF